MEIFCVLAANVRLNLFISDVLRSRQNLPGLVGSSLVPSPRHPNTETDKRNLPTNKNIQSKTQELFFIYLNVYIPGSIFGCD